jgi:hypothetical protein
MSRYLIFVPLPPPRPEVAISAGSRSPTNTSGQAFFDVSDLTMTSATVYRGSSDGKVIQGKEIYDAGGENVLLKVHSSSANVLTSPGYAFWFMRHRSSLLFPWPSSRPRGGRCPPQDRIESPSWSFFHRRITRVRDSVISLSYLSPLFARPRNLLS